MSVSRRAGFAVATVMQQSSLPLAAIFGWLVLGDAIGAQAWAGIAVTSVGLAILSWPARDQMRGAALGTVLGLASGAAFAVALNAYRQAGLMLEPHHPIYSATASVCVAQAIQTSVLVAALAAPAVLYVEGRRSSKTANDVPREDR